MDWFWYILLPVLGIAVGVIATVLVFTKMKKDAVEKIKKAMEQIDERYKNNNCEDVNEFISNYLDGLLEETKHENISVYKGNSFFDYQVEKPAYIRFFNRFYSKKGDSFILDLFYGELEI